MRLHGEGLHKRELHERDYTTQRGNYRMEGLHGERLLVHGEELHRERILVHGEELHGEESHEEGLQLTDMKNKILNISVKTSLIIIRNINLLIPVDYTSFVHLL